MCCPSAKPDEPLVLVATERNARRLTAACPQAREQGLAPGMTPADALARVPGLCVDEADPAADTRLLLRLSDMALRWSPIVQPDPPDGLLIDISGCTHLFGGEDALAADATALLGRHLSVRHTIASTPSAAHALARFPVSAASEEQAIRCLPVAALGLPPEAETALRRAGLKLVGDLADRPTAPLSARFGKQAALALDRLLGRADHRLSPRRPLPALQFARRFAEPIAHVDSVLGAVDGLAMKAARVLEQRHQGGRSFAISLCRSDGEMRELALETGQPTRDPALLQRLLRERVEALSDPLDPGFGFDLIRFAVAATEPLESVQADLQARGKQGEALSALIDRLSVRHGRERIRRLLPVDSHVPERAVRSVPALDDGQAAAWPLPPPGEPPLRPICLLDPPEPIEVLAEVPDAPPRRFRWRGVSHIVTRAEGPERIAAPWWQKASEGRPTRDYYRVEDEAGRRFWLFRRGLHEREAGHPSWFIHGQFA
ncbi:DNA polymerase Y family protein [Sandaracinobacter neustonicus]|uniref:DNA-directed DNA polymerase n=2 Tax=Sandaracinobacter neustonicus TaxID=1715348 RepID=A0A501XKC2_9SPHN|nr:DNA polymerase Y family protein [Sandaracinobacter neustonicus]